MATEIKKKAQENKTSTQHFLDIAEIRENTMVLRGGGLRAVLLVSSVNFALKSEEEQNALISSYVRFLNSINFPVQIVIQSRRLNLDRYLEKLNVLQKEQPNELLRVQIGEYLSFVRELLEIGDIMTKRFFVVIPLEPLSVSKQKGFFAEVKKIFHPGDIIRYDRKHFETLKQSLEKRISFARSGLESIGLKVVPLDTQALIELAYGSYNPQLARIQPLPAMDQVQIGTQM